MNESITRMGGRKVKGQRSRSVGTKIISSS